MKAYQRACLVLAQEGVAGLCHRVQRRLFGNREISAPPPPNVREMHAQMVKDFHEKAAKLAHGDLRKYYWYHTIDLGQGLVTPGDYDYRASVHLFQFPANMSGMEVLDIGSATGFFAFEFERRGSNVTSVDLPSIADWDMPVEEREQTLKSLMASHQASSLEELQYLHLDGPFGFCRKMLNSKVQRCHSTIYDLSAKKLGKSGFDLVFMGDILLHTFSPLKALAAVAPLCRGTLVISQEMSKDTSSRPLMFFGAETEDRRTWWFPNLTCFEQMLRRLGFRNVSVVGHHTGFGRPQGFFYDRNIIHATKS